MSFGNESENNGERGSSKKGIAIVSLLVLVLPEPHTFPLLLLILLLAHLSLPYFYFCLLPGHVGCSPRERVAEQPPFLIENTQRGGATTTGN
jgi:hypothetical protein